MSVLLDSCKGLMCILFVCQSCSSGAVFASLRPAAPRTVLNLDGVWQVEQGDLDSRPQAFAHTVPVPGLLDMAQPTFKDVGKPSTLRRAFWYRRTFKVDGPIPEVAVLKIYKAKYGTKVILNGRIAGEHLPCFTPAYMEVRSLLKGEGQENELVIRVGADRQLLPEGMPTGWDFEKYLFLPGIYDSVDLILTGQPYIRNVQAAPDIDAKSVRVVVELDKVTETKATPLPVSVTETSTGRRVGGLKDVKLSNARLVDGKFLVDITIPISNCRLWSPEDPFLYELYVSTGKDAATVRFGMRSFRFDPQTKRAVLNGKTYYMRGSNVTIYRFFEDSERRDRPWRAAWVRLLHRKFKSMHWNSLRYCIGFPPELWYDIADEEGFLIQDEFPIWLLNKAPENPKAEKIIPEYTEWMRERWDHPCVVIWDAQNESYTAETGKALQAVRHLDLSNRPWDNGWAEPQSMADCVEAHPYEFIRAWEGRAPFRLREMATWSGVPELQNAQKKLSVPIIINEYAWLWLTRDGNPTCLTDRVYQSLLGPNSTVDQRRLIYARYLAALTEFWRCHREVAGVLHFCGLGYSRPGDKPRPEGGATSDHFLNLETLDFEPKFREYVGEAFNPVGLMLDMWDEEVAAGSERQLKVYVVNDLYQDWQGEVRLRIEQKDEPQGTKSQSCTVPALGRRIVPFTQTFPSEPGSYTIVADLTDPSGKVVRSLRDFKIIK
ncbi:MAG TPA: glycoside hydrolase family 2 TIM barrel-domain containing protein [Acidobacteriota bacterium]|nr:glycoside hydrolase family 2 TIM barrel-domain containing protein [Acidobacteriota bacterium]